MKVIYNNIIPSKGFKCVNLFGVLFVRRGSSMDGYSFNHEEIHTAQMRELLYIFFYIIYFFEWITNLIVGSKNAYKDISFEKEAYQHELDLSYLETRKHFAQWRNG